MRLKTLVLGLVYCAASWAYPLVTATTYISTNSGDVVYVPTWAQKDVNGNYNAPAGKEILYLHLNNSTGYYELWSCAGSLNSSTSAVCNTSSQTCISCSSAFKTMVWGSPAAAKSMGRCQYSRDGNYAVCSYQDAASTLPGYGVPSAPGAVRGTTPGPFAITSGVNDTLSLKVDGGTTYNVVFSAGSTSAAAVASQINAQATGLVASATSTNHVLILTGANGAGHSIGIIASNGTGTLGFTNGATYTGAGTNGGPGCTGDPGIGCDHHIAVFKSDFSAMWPIDSATCSTKCGGTVPGFSANGTRAVPVNGQWGGWFPAFSADGTRIAWSNNVCLASTGCPPPVLLLGNEIEWIAWSPGANFPSTANVISVSFVTSGGVGIGGANCSGANCTLNDPSYGYEMHDWDPTDPLVFYLAEYNLIQTGNVAQVSLHGSGSVTTYMPVCASPYTDPNNCHWNEHVHMLPDRSWYALATTIDTGAVNGQPNASPVYAPATYPPYQEIDFIDPTQTNGLNRFKATNFNTGATTCHRRFDSVELSPDQQYLLLGIEETQANGAVCSGAHSANGYSLVLLSIASITITNPLSTSVVGAPSWPGTLSATVAGMPNVARVDFYVDSRFECSTRANIGNTFSCVYRNATWHDFRAEQVHAVAVDNSGNTIATSPTNTFNIRNHGINLANTFNQSTSSPVSGSLIWTAANNATSTTANYPGGGPGMRVDGLPFGTQGYATATSNINTSTGKITMPVMPYYTTMPVYVDCVKKNQFHGSSCTSFPGNLNNYTTYYVIADTGNTMRLASSAANAAAGTSLSISGQGDSDGAFTVTPTAAPWWVNGGGGAFSKTINTTYFPNGYHRLESLLVSGSSTQGISGTLQFASTAVAVASNSIGVANHPFTEGMTLALTTTGALPGGLSSPCLAHVIDQNNFNCQGQTITSQGSGTNTATFTSTLGQFDYTGISGASQNIPQIASDVTRVNFQNGGARMALMPANSPVYLTPGETSTIGAYYMNTDGTTSSVSAGSLLYGAEDSTIATVSSTGIITGAVGGATPPKETWITIIDNANKYSALVQVFLVADHNTFQHFSIGGHGILSTYTQGQSFYPVEGFGTFAGEDSNQSATNPRAIANWFPWSGISVIGGLQSLGNSWNNFSNYSTWLTDWNGAASYGAAVWRKATLLGQVSVSGSPYPAMGFYNSVVGGFNSLYNTPWKQQAYATERNDLAPYQIYVEGADETNSHVGSIAKTYTQMGSGNDSLNYYGTCNASNCGLISITVTGCPATPCTGTATASYITYNNLYTAGSNKPVYIWGATNTALNGGYWLTGVTYDTNDILSQGNQRAVSVTFTARNVLNGTYNLSTDPNLNLGMMWAGYFGTYNPKSNCIMGSAGCASSIVVSGNVATVTWNSHGFSTGRVIGLSGFTNSASAWMDASGQHGLYPITVTNSNTFTIPVFGVSAGTYNSASDTGAKFEVNYDPSSEVIQSVPWYLSTPTSSGGWNSTTHAPQGWPQTAGGSIVDRLGYKNVSDYNSIYQSWSHVTRGGAYIWDSFVGSNAFGAIFDIPQGLAGPGYNYFVNGPFLFLTEGEGSSCTLEHPGYKCFLNGGQDRQEVGEVNAGNVFTQNIWPIISGRGAGARFYETEMDYDKVNAFKQWNTSGNYSAGYQSKTDWIEDWTDNWTALAEVSNFAQRHLPYVLAPPASSPYYGPLVMSGVRNIPSGGGTMHLVGNWSEEAQTVTVNLSQFELGGPVHKEMVTTRGTIVTPLSPTTTTDTCTMLYAQTCAYFFQPNGAADELTYTSFSFNPAQFGASKVTLEVHYYAKDDALAIYDCTSGCTVPAGLTAQYGLSPVWYRYSYLAANGSVLAQSDLLRFK